MNQFMDIEESQPMLENNNPEPINNIFYNFFHYITNEINYINLLKHLTNDNIVSYISPIELGKIDIIYLFYSLYPFAICDLTMMNYSCKSEKYNFMSWKVGLSEFILVRGSTTFITFILLKIVISHMQDEESRNILNKYIMINWINILINLLVLFNIGWHIIGINLLINISDYNCINELIYSYVFISYIFIFILVINCLYRFIKWLRSTIMVHPLYYLV